VAVVVAAVIALAPMTAPGGDRFLWVAIAAASIPLTLIACSGRPSAATWAVVASGTGYAGSLVGRTGFDARAPLIGAGLFALSELIHWSLIARASAPSGRSDQRRIVDLTLFGLGSAVIGAIVLATGSIDIRGGVELAIVGVVASLAILGLILSVSRRTAGSRSSGTPAASSTPEP
jgi:hypothetical protein